MNVITYTDARNGLASAMDRVVQDREETVITRTGRESVVMVAQGEWDAIQATLHLLSSPRNAERLRESVEAGPITYTENVYAIFLISDGT